MTAVAAALASALAIWLWVGPSSRYGRMHVEPVPPRAASGDRWHGGVAVGAVLVPAVGVLWGGGTGVAVAMVIVLVVSTAALLLRRGRRRAEARRAGAEVAVAAGTVSGLLRAGRIPTLALIEAAADVPLLTGAAAELTMGGDPSDELRRAALKPGRQALARLADAWSISARTGAPLAGVWARTTDMVAAQEEVVRVVEAELAAARSSGRMMACLPAVGLLLGGALGGDPIGFLFGSPVGWVCLVGAGALTCAGLLWLDAIAASAGGR